MCAILLLGAAFEAFGKARLTKSSAITWCLLAGIALTIFQASTASSRLQEKLGNPNDAVSAALDVDTTPNSETSAVLSPKRLLRPISVYVPATRRRLVDLVYGIGIFLASTVLLVERKQVYPVMLSLMAVGAAVSFLGILQKLSGDMRIFWQYELLWGGGPFGSFVNSNNAAGFLIICFSAALFFGMEEFFKRSRSTGGNRSSFVLTADDCEVENHADAGLLHRLGRLAASVKPRHLYLLTGLTIILAGVFASLSRSGMVAIVLSVLTALYLVSKTQRIAVLGIALLLGVGAIAMVNLSGQMVRVSTEIQSMAELSDAAAPRLDHWKDAIPFGIENGILGVGNGTYRYVSPVFQSFFLTRTFAHAESVYIETLVEMGWGGILLLLTTISYAAYVSIGLLKRRNYFDRAIGGSALTCLVGQVTIATLDFGIYQPANTTAMAILMGIAAGRYSRLPQENSRGIHPAAGSRNVVVGLVLLVTLALSSWAAYESYGIESRRAAQRSIKLFNKYASEGQQGIHRADFDKIQRRLETATTIRPDDAEAHYLLGDLHIARFREREARNLRDSLRAEIEEIETSELPLDQQRLRLDEIKEVDSKAIWNATAVSLLHQRLRQAERRLPEVAIQIKSDTGVTSHLKTAMQEYQRAEQLCSRTSKTQYRMAQLIALTTPQSAADTQTQESAFIEEALQRSFPKTQLLFNCGLLALNSGDMATATELWKKCLGQPHSIRHERMIVLFCLQDLPMKQFYEEVLPQKPAYLLLIARKYLSAPELKLPQKFLISHVKRTINAASDLTKIQRILLLAEAALLVDDYPEVVAQYRQALVISPQQASWRYDYAFALFQTKQFDESVRQLKLCELDPTVRKNRIKFLLAKIRRERSK